MTATPDDVAIQAVTRALRDHNCPHPDTTARHIITILRGRGWRPTQARPQPPWQATPRHASAPTPEWRAARAALKEETAE